jgi:hypothetical protein
MADREYYVLVRPTMSRHTDKPEWTADSVYADVASAIARTIRIDKAAPYTDTSVVHVAALSDAKRAVYDEQLRVKNTLPQRIAILKARGDHVR